MAKIHFIGIGGISMSGLAEILIDRGNTVTGSDSTPSDITKHLQELGAKISFPQAAENVEPDTDEFIYTAAIHPDNPEFMAAKATGKPMLSRAELLGQIMESYKDSVCVAGTHGKTSTTCMVSEILLAANEDPTISVGGIMPSIKSNIRVGKSAKFVAEACEYTNSFHHFYPRYNIILNVEEDHMDFFKDLQDVRNSFRRFAENTSDDGVLVIGAEIPDVNELTEGLKCKVITFGLNEGDIYATNIKYNENGLPSFTPVFKGEKLPTVVLHVPGEHNIKNALAAIACTKEMGASDDAVTRGLSNFGGAKRRFEYKGIHESGAVVIDDYAHHPTEIRSSLTAAANYPHKRLIVVFQPHTYTRTKAFLDDFGKALSTTDLTILAPIYPAREEDIYGVHSEDVTEKINESGGNSISLPDFKSIEDYLKKNIKKGDLLITMGAGNVVDIGEHILED